uniref:RFX-type winged-helix domain-containing protein n=1 Tax=Meloidogyne enterolobii TaxID=390850 RepID=A0A6V7VNC4_MELEN|nr:unnamed protein product [Meloidogyne enterolobii]
MELPPFLAPCPSSFISPSSSSSSSTSSNSSSSPSFGGILPPVNLLGNSRPQPINNNLTSTNNNQQQCSTNLSIHSSSQLSSSSSSCSHQHHHPSSCWTLYSQETDNNNNNTNGGFQPPPPPPHQHGNGGTYSRISCMIDPSGRQQHPSSSSISSTPSPGTSSSTAIVNRPCGRIIGEEGVTTAKLDLSRSYVIGTMGGQQQQQQATLAAVSSSTPITFHILTANSLLQQQQNNPEHHHHQLQQQEQQQQQINYFSTGRRQIQQQQILQQQQQLIEASHYHQHTSQHPLNPQQQPPTSTLLQSPHTFVLRRSGLNNQRKSPNISVDEVEVEGGGGGENNRQIIIIDEDINSENEGKRTKNCSKNDNEGEQNNQNNIAKAPPETLEWIKANYELVEGASLPRNILYKQYIDHCKELGFTQVNAASFGKLIRQVFNQKLSTRRLGTRGNSKYHYNGICLKQNSPLRATMSADELERMMNGSQQPHKNSQRSQRKQQFNNNNLQKSKRKIEREINSNNLNNFSSSAATSPCEEREESINIELEQQYQQQQSPPIIYPSNINHHNQHQQSTTTTLNTSSSLSPPTFLLPPPQLNDLIEIKEGGLRLPEIELPILDECILLRYGLSVGHVLKFFDEYREHSRKVLNCVKDFRLKLIEQLWISFWQKNIVYDGDIEQCQQRGRNEENNVELGLMRGAPILDNRSLCRLCSLPEIISYVETFDLKFYQIILDFFFSSPLRIPLESDLCNNLRNFGKSIEFWMENALGGGNNSNLNYLIPPAFKKAKLECIRLLANSLTRLSSFVHLAITARSVLQNKEQVKKVHDDFNRVDFGVFHWQADWLCSSNSSLNKNSFQESTELNESFCSCNVLARELVGQFRERLSRHCSIEEWADWLESIVDKALNFPKTFKYSPQQIASKGKRFLLAWTLHSSLLLKEITLHSSTSFGEFHLVRLVFDDYLLIIMERKLAKILGKLPIELMAPEWLQMEASLNQAQQQNTTQTTLKPEKTSLNFSSSPNNPPNVSTSSSLVHLLPSSTTQHYQNFYSTNIQQQQQKQQHQQTNTTTHYPMVEKLPLPGPEPPLDMLNVNGEEDVDDYQQETTTINLTQEALTPPQIQKKFKINIKK